MGYTHTVQKWNGKIFVQLESSSTSYYSMGAYMPGDDDIDEVEADTLGELYKLWQEAKAGDASCGEKEWKYRFYKHTIKEEKRSDGKPVFADYVCEGKIYRRGNKVFSDRRRHEEAIYDYQKGRAGVFRNGTLPRMESRASARRRCSR